MRSFPGIAELLAEPKLAALILDPAPALVFDPQGTLRFANRAAVSAYGAASLAELIEKSPALFGEMPDTAREFAETLPLNGTYRREAIALAKDTETFRCERVGLSNGLQVVLFTGLARERFDGDVGKSFGVLFDGERAPFALFDHDGKPLHANRLATAIMGPAGTLVHLHASAASAISDANLKGFAEIPFGVLRIALKKLSLGSHSLLLASFTQPERPTATPAAPPAEPQAAAAEERQPATQTRAEAELPDVIALGPPAELQAGNALDASDETASEETVDDDTPPAQAAQIVDAPPPAEEHRAEAETEAAKEVLEPESSVAVEHEAIAEAEERVEPEDSAEAEDPVPTAQALPETQAAAVDAATIAPPPPILRTPSRFVWQVDADGRFTNISADLGEAVGGTQSGQIGEDWPTLAARAGITKTEALFAAVKRRDTWSGVSVLWPVEGTDTARPVDLAALPVFDRERNFLGYRGFGVFREPIPFIAKPRPVTTPAQAAADNGTEREAAKTAPSEETVADGEFPLVQALVETMPTAAPVAKADNVSEETAANDEFPLAQPVDEDARTLRDIASALEDDLSEAQDGSVDDTPAEDAAVEDENDEVTAANEESEEEEAPIPAVPDHAATQDAEAPASPQNAAPEKTSALTAKEQIAFREIGRVLLQDTLGSERAGVLRDLDRAIGLQAETSAAETPEEQPETPALEASEAAPQAPSEPAPMLAPSADLTGVSERALMDRIPLGIAVHRDEKLLYANRALLDWVGFENLETLEQSGGLSRIFSGAAAPAGEADPTISRTLAVQGPKGEPIPVETRLFSTPWYGKAALVYVLRRANAGFDERRESMERALRAAEAATRDQQAILDTATDGVLIIDRDGKVLGMNKSAEALFSFDFAEVQNSSFTMLFAPESHRAAVDYLDKLASNGVASILNDGREVVGRERNGGLIPLFMNLGKVGDDGQKFCAVLRDITQWKRAEEELTSARRQAETASSHKSDFLAKISHEMRTPLNAIIGFAEVMIEERFGPIGSERYREYLKDIHQSGAHLISLINDLLDLSKIEAGKLELDFTSVDLNDVAKQCISIMQPQANRERIIIRTALAEHLPPVVADLRSIRQIVLNLLSNSVKFTRPGGQVILSTSTTDKGEVVMRVRDTGVGMSGEEITAALEPFRQLATSGRDTKEGTGLGLPLTKALVEANRASFQIKSAVNSGTLIEIAFPSTRVLAG